MSGTDPLELSELKLNSSYIYMKPNNPLVIGLMAQSN